MVRRLPAAAPYHAGIAAAYVSAQKLLLERRLCVVGWHEAVFDQKLPGFVQRKYCVFGTKFFLQRRFVFLLSIGQLRKHGADHIVVATLDTPIRLLLRYHDFVNLLTRTDSRDFDFDRTLADQ